MSTLNAGWDTGIFLLDNIAHLDEEGLHILDRRVYPFEVRWVSCPTVPDVAKAIIDMVTQSRGPGVVAGYGMVLAARLAAASPDPYAALTSAASILANTRRTHNAVQLAVNSALAACAQLPPDEWERASSDLVLAGEAEREAQTSSVGRVGASLLSDDKGSMIERHEELARAAAGDGVQVIGFQELFYGPYFGAVQDQKYYQYAEPVPGPTTERFQALARELGLVIVLPVYEVANEGEYYNTAAVIDADGTLLGKYRKHHIPHLPSFWEKFYFRPGNLGYPVFDTAAGRVGVYICYDRHFPEGWRELGLGNAQIVFNPSATKPGLSNQLWQLEQPAAAAANQYFVAASNRIGQEADEFSPDAPHFYGSSYFVDPRGDYVGAVASRDKEEILTRDLDLDLITAVRNDWQFYRDRRPESCTRTVLP